MVVEGMFTAEAAVELVKRVGVEMPITEGIYKIINEEIEVHEAVAQLMERDKKEE
jgi:glycerol-3-phosphate dehydrogenase (NAD(P)+)